MDKEQLCNAIYYLQSAINEIAVFVYRNNDHFFINEEELSELSAVSFDIQNSLKEIEKIKENDLQKSSKLRNG